MSTVQRDTPVSPDVHYRQTRRSRLVSGSPGGKAEVDAYLSVQTLLEIRAVAGMVIDADAEARAILAARRVIRDLLAAGGNGFRALHLIGMLDVLDGWLDGCTNPQLHAQWNRIAATL